MSLGYDVECCVANVIIFEGNEPSITSDNNNGVTSELDPPVPPHSWTPLLDIYLGIPHCDSKPESVVQEGLKRW